MNFLRWFIRPHFSPLSLAAIGFLMYTLGWFHSWWPLAVCTMIPFAGEYFFCRY